MEGSVELSVAPRSCPICATADESFVFAESNVDLGGLDAYAFASRKLPEYMHWRLMECRRCDLVYASPAPVTRSLASAYEEAAFDSEREAAFAARTYSQFLSRIRSRVATLDGALDIGTGDGVFLGELLDAGFTDVIGVEPSRAPIRAASDRVRSLIRQQTFRSDDFTPESFSLVTCFQTLEHIAEPLAMSRDIHKILKPGGALLYVVHNRRAASAKLLGRKSPIFDIEHLQLFSPNSLRRLLTVAGFESVEMGSFLNRYPLSYWTRLFPFPSPLKSLLLGAMHRTGFGGMSVALPAGNMFAVGFKARA